jgi:hypothetical protein
MPAFTSGTPSASMSSTGAISGAPRIAVIESLNSMPMPSAPASRVAPVCAIASQARAALKMTVAYSAGTAPKIRSGHGSTS